ncbi:MAG: NnrS family protein [Candidatus Omnitrophica bacterium]|nr:NnrS family protein [Candidatus Omnitrophota bacterium]
MNNNAEPNDGPVVLQTGFRIFFLGAAGYAVVSMLIWMLFYVMGQNVFVAMPLTVWHGHEMIFGYTMAVVAGFLLTAVMNWTGLPTLRGGPLLILFVFWAGARVLAFMPGSFPQWPLAVCNLAFMIFLAVAVIRPIVQVKQWRQSAVISKIILLIVSGIVLYIALYHSDLVTERKALRFAVYMLVSLIFTISRRIIPFFIEKGVEEPVHLRNSKFLDITSMALLVAFSILDVFWPQRAVIALLCLALTIVHSLRLAGWHTPQIWSRPLLWVLFCGYLFLIAGFVLKFLTAWGGHPDDAALHAWTAGGIGIFTLGMMARVSWGHTGRPVRQPPRGLSAMFGLLITGAVVRTFLPLAAPEQYVIWIAVSQILWMCAFALYLVVYGPVLITARPDGKKG